MIRLDLNATKDLPEATCPSCGRSNNAATALENEDVRPGPGDVAVCFGCAAFCIYTPNMGLDLMTLDQIAALDAGQVMDMNRARRHILSFHSLLSNPIDGT